VTALVSAIKWGEYYVTPNNNYPVFAARQYSIGRQFDISSWFISFDSSVSGHGEFTAAAGTGQTLLIAWQPSRTVGLKLSDLLAGSFDTKIDEWLTWALGLTVPVVFRWGHEMNGQFMNWNPLHADNTSTITAVSSTGSAATTVTVSAATTLASGQQVQIQAVGGALINGAYTVTVVDSTHFTIPVANSAAWTSGGTVQWSNTTLNAAQYVSAFQYMVTKARAKATSLGVTNNVKWFWCTNQNDTGTNGGIPLEQFYPGTTWVDYVGYDSYNTLNGSYMTPLQTLQGHTNSTQADTYTRVTALHPTAPVWIGEFGCVDLNDPKDTTHTATGHSKAQWYTDLFAIDLTAIPRLGGACWFDTNGSRNWLHDTTTGAWNAFVSTTTGFLQGSYTVAQPPVPIGGQAPPWTGYDLPGPETHVFSPDPATRDHPREHNAIWHWLNQIVTKVNGWTSLVGNSDGSAPALKGVVSALGTAATGILRLEVPLTGVKRAISVAISGDANDRFGVDADGKVQWGPGGATPVDVNLYRGGVSTLATDSAFTLGTRALTAPAFTATVDTVLNSTVAPAKPTAGAGVTRYALADASYVGQAGKAWMQRPRADDVNVRFCTFDPALATGTVSLTAGVLYLAKVWVGESRLVASCGCNVATAGVGLSNTFCGAFDAGGALLGSSLDLSVSWQSTGQKLNDLTVATISGVSTANPTVVTTAAAHGLTTGNQVTITGIVGATQANGTWAVTVTDATHFTVPVNVTGTYASGGKVYLASLNVAPNFFWAGFLIGAATTMPTFSGVTGLPNWNLINTTGRSVQYGSGLTALPGSVPFGSASTQTKLMLADLY